MIEPNNPVDLGREELNRFKSAVEGVFGGFMYQGKSRSLAALMRRIDPDEHEIMGDVERETYLALRDGFELFKGLCDLLADKTELRKKLASTPTPKLATDPEIASLRHFTHTYATWATSLYIQKRLEKLIRSEGVEEEGASPDLTMLKLDSAEPESAVMKRLLLPLFAQLVNHSKTGEVFKTPLEFPLYAKEVFHKYVDLAIEDRDKHPALNRHLEGYTFRILDETLVLEGYEDKTVPTGPDAEQTQVSFQPIQPNEIVGNRMAKRKVTRYIDRLALYDTEEEMNPVLELGGLSWSNLFDGLPGTGKSSMFRMAMTRLRDLAENLGRRYHIITVDQSIKDEYYGKTGKILLQRLQATHDAGALTMVVFDDIDLLTSKRDDAQGADNDINNIIMQYMDGVFTVRRGNVINFAASNKPTGVDEALRNRFNDRLLVDGPVTAEDFADMVILMGGKLLDRGLLEIEKGYSPYATQDMQERDGSWSGEDVASYMADSFEQNRSSNILDFGTFVSTLKEKSPRITGRSMKAILEAIKERCADFDVPAEWLETPTAYAALPYSTKAEKVAELYRPITPDILFQEAQRYFESESRYAGVEAESAVEKGYNAFAWNVQAELQYYEEQLAEGSQSDLGRLMALRDLSRKIALEHSRLLEAHLARKPEDAGQ